MTIDKIKHYMGADLFNHWCSVHDLSILEKAKTTLSNEIEAGLLVGIKYQAELRLLHHLTQKIKSYRCE